MDKLDYFNQQVLRYQDDAYTLACYLVGSEPQAERITQEAVAAAFRLCPQQNGAPHSTNCRLLLLRQVCRLCRALRPAGSGTAGLPWLFNSFSIAIHERMVLVLVDVLDLDYRQAAAVLGLPVKNIGRLLAGARRKLGSPQPAELEAATADEHRADGGWDPPQATLPAPTGKERKQI